MRAIEFHAIMELTPPLSHDEMKLAEAQRELLPYFAELARQRRPDGTLMQGLFLHTETGVLTKLARNIFLDPVWLEVTGDIEYEEIYYHRMYYNEEDS